MDSVKIGINTYPAIVTGKLEDLEYDRKPTKTIKAQMTYQEANTQFINGVSWSILSGNQEYDNSDYNVAGPITDFRDGWVSVKMIKQPESQGSGVDDKILNILFGEEP